MSESIRHSLTIPPEAAGQRLDQALAQLLSTYSRSRIKEWIDAGQVSVDGLQSRGKDRLVGGERIEVDATLADVVTVAPEAIDLDIVHQDRHVLVINKPVGLVVHPGAGNPAGTLQNALLNFDAKLARIPRAGIVHRIDKDTSGLLVIARTLDAHTALTRAIEEHAVEREYEAICSGVMTGGGSVEAAIGRHPTDRLRMAIRESGRDAITHYRVIHRYRGNTHVRCTLETGRTHQIRVHLAHIRYPIVGDRLYGGRLLLPKGASPELIEALRGFKRQALHAARLRFEHPVSRKPIECVAPLPKDMTDLLAVLAADAGEKQVSVAKNARDAKNKAAPGRTKKKTKR
jgi:23S rRNA pseudouridine1911/1915/1917 synthase